MHSFVGQGSIRALCPLRITSWQPTCYCLFVITGYAHTRRGPLLGQYFATNRNRSLKRNGWWNCETRSAASQCRIRICAWVNLHQYWPIVPENLEACCNSRGNTFVQVRLSSVHKHTNRKGEGRGREQGEPVTTKQRGNKRKEQTTADNRQGEQAGRTKNGKGRREGEEAHRNPTLARRKANSAKQNRQQNKNTAARGREEEEEREGKEKDGKEKVGGRGMSQAMRSASMDPPGRGGKVYPAIHKYPGSHQEWGEGGVLITPSCPWPLSSVVSAWTSIIGFLVMPVELLCLMATSLCGYWFIVPHEVECLCHGRLLLLCSKDRRLQSCESSQLTRNMGKCPLMAIQPVETNRRHDQVRSNAHNTLEIGYVVVHNTLEIGYVVEVLLIDLVLALKIPELLHPYWAKFRMLGLWLSPLAIDHRKILDI